VISLDTGAQKEIYPAWRLWVSTSALSDCPLGRTGY